jgi:hypothetical protein
MQHNEENSNLINREQRKQMRLQTRGEQSLRAAEAVVSDFGYEQWGSFRVGAHKSEKLVRLFRA